jgi:hypothetical protein
MLLCIHEPNISFANFSSEGKNNGLLLSSRKNSFGYRKKREEKFTVSIYRVCVCVCVCVYVCVCTHTHKLTNV